MHPFPAWYGSRMRWKVFLSRKHVFDWRVKKSFKRTCLDKVLPRFGGAFSHERCENREKTAFRSLWSNSPVKKGQKRAFKGYPLPPVKMLVLEMLGKVDPNPCQALLFPTRHHEHFSQLIQPHEGKRPHWTSCASDPSQHERVLERSAKRHGHH